MMVVDLLHEFELGVWKTPFTHLIRTLHAGEVSKHPRNTCQHIKSPYIAC